MEVADAYDSNRTRSGMTYEVFDRSIFMHHQTHSDYDRAFALVMQQGLLVERLQRTQPHCIDYDLTLSAGTLREHIALAGLIDGTPTEELIRCFLSLSSSFGYYVEPDRHQPMPLARSPASIPPQFVEAVEALSEAGFCTVSGGSLSWLPKVAGLMEAEGLWVEGNAVDDIRRTQLASIWRSMPEELKCAIKDDDGRVNPLVLSAMIWQHWDLESDWLVNPSVKSRNQDFLHRQLSRSSAEIAEMVEGGTLR